MKYLSFVVAFALALAPTFVGAQQNRVTPTLAAAPSAPSTNTATAAPQRIGPPVTCEAKGYWSGAGSAYLILKRLNPVAGTVEIDGVPAGMPSARWGGPESDARWTYRGDQLEYNRANARRYRLTVGEDFLKGSFENFDTPAQSKPDITYKCDGPINRVIVQ